MWRKNMNTTKKTVDGFCGQGNGYSRSITLRNRLIPIGKTQENLEKLKVLEDDFARAKAYVEVKALIDDFHRSFIEDVLSKVKIQWKPLFEEFELYQKETDKINKNKIKKHLEKIQVDLRKDVVKNFKDDKRFAKLFKKELLSELLPEVIKSAPESEISNKQAALSVFDKFSTYFTGFHENRMNMYSEDDKATAISNRIVNENFPKFYANIKVFEYLQKNFPNIISDTEQSLKNFLNGKKLADIFSAEAFNEVLSQKGIDFYNTVIGGISGEAGSEKVQGLNEKINLASQQLPNEEKAKLRKKMTVLYKMILSDKNTASFIPVGFEDSNQVYESVKQFKEQSFDKAKSIIDEAFKNSDFDLNQVFVPAKEQTAFSLSIFGNWAILGEGLFLLETDNSKKVLSEKKIEELHKEIGKKDYSLADLQKAYERWAKEYGLNIEKNVRNYFLFSDLRTDEKTKEKFHVNILESIELAYSKIDFEKCENLVQEKESATPIKDFLDGVQNLYHYLKLVDYRGEEQKDSNFYLKLEEILETFSEIIPLYNKVRNFVTKKPGEVKKIKLNFNNVSLAKGWDVNKESDYTCTMLRKNGKYFLGIFNPKDKPKFDEENSNSESCSTIENCYEKLIYKYFKDVTTMIPKCTTQLKDVKKHFEESATDFIIDNDSFIKPLRVSKEVYELNNLTFDGKKKFQIDYLRNTGDQSGYDNAVRVWIDFCMEFMKSYKSTSVYDYASLGDCSQFKQVDQFYSSINQLLYKIWFVKVSESKINSLVDSSKLYLFQIYNKDFAEKSTGKKNLHTLYWENLFSEENLKDVCLKLNGEAELFFRPANKDLKLIKHEKGSVLVNRTTSDGKSIPEEIYQEIYQFKNKISDKLSDEAKSFLDSGKVVCKEAKHEITKDKHFVQDTYLFHCPITMNFKASEITGKKFNEKVLDALKNNPDMKVIGLDRGERHLIYLSLINQKGEIELQKTLNLVDQVRNDKIVKVDYQEKLVHKEGDRDKARKNWQTIGNIKELKEGYLSNIVHEIAKLMVENNAIVVMEDLNFGFKRGRFAVERQVYQKFENMLIEKLNYLVFKDKAVTEPGGVLNAYQLTDKSMNVSDVYKQCGWLFYIPAAYTSKIDPKTGFANLLNFAGLTNVLRKREFFSKFIDLHFDSETQSFAFTFDYKDFGGKGTNEMSKSKWTAYSRDKRIVYISSKKSTEDVNITENLKNLFTEYGINYLSCENLYDVVMEIGSELKSGEKPNSKISKFWDSFIWNLKLVFQMRNSRPNSTEDYLISPVKADDGTFFDSRIEFEKTETHLPIDADANGAYHIALKGLYLLKNDFNRNEKGEMQYISNAQWFKFVQDKDFLK